MDAPKAFFSCSWDDDQHKKWVANLATRLRDEEVETILDQWHTVLGDQLTEPLERRPKNTNCMRLPNP